MKVVHSRMWPHVVGVVFVLLTFIVFGEIIVDGSEMSSAATSRHLKENGDGSSTIDKGQHDGAVSLEDYRPYDPSPSSKASVRPGPIQHGTPMIPYIPNPKPSPPSHSNDHDDDDDDDEGSP